MTDMTQMTGAYALSWLPWILIPLITYILPFPIFALVFLWIEKEAVEEEV
ncbi:Photosystem I reaction center subunit VIII (modular protein) [Hyella patelloides LEGE 07179]|uniref:Photosystem I reaction center subunit VIII (Modular protein) n=1 Tax=Hyella patelloides LEGE 07179 TaxID=945734 RepID=A0A563VUE1_9CYAN|nr:photosystem I reaction center subunit VIII [Hyella patelloides]VEP15057.1 Photosystem I reaction center subunit VIII (modular protein) [Hyella patelloides LEGE 07179]